MVDVGVLGSMKESVMLLPTPTLITGIERLILSGSSRAVTGIMVAFPAQAKGTSFNLLNIGSSFLNTHVLECLAGGQSCGSHTGPVLMDLVTSLLLAEGTVLLRL